MKTIKKVVSRITERKNGMENGYFGAMEGYDQRNWTVDKIIADLPSAPADFYSRKAQYHQPDVQRNSCTLHSAIGAVSDLIGYVFSLKERKEILDMARKMGFNDSWGWYLQDAVKCVATYCKDKHLANVSYYMVKIGSPEFYLVLKKRYTVMAGYYGNQAHLDDIRDGMVDHIITGNWTFGHALDIVYEEGKEWEKWNLDGVKFERQYAAVMRDSYAKGRTRPNLYRMPCHYFDEMVKGLPKDRKFFKYGFIYVLNK